MFKQVSVYNFKAIEKLENVPFGRITLIGGENNSGKTTVLEALFLYADHHNPVALNTILGWRDFAGKASPIEIWQPFFYDKDLSKVIKIEANASGKNLSPTDQLYIKYLTEYNASVQLPIIENGVTSIKSSFPALELVHTSDNTIDYQVHILSQDTIYNYLKEIDLSKEQPKIFYMGERLSLYHSNVEYHGVLDQADEQEKILPLLRLLEPRLLRLQLINNGVQDIIYADLGNKKKIAVNLLGDGFCRCLTMGLVIASKNVDVFLVDEAGGGIHHSFHDAFWEFMNCLSLEHNCQIIATTHSYEFIESFSRVCKKQNNDDVAYIRLDKDTNNTIRAYSFNSEDLTFTLSHELELR
jgi:AAA15 family ATPase/GTPase